jgi:diguanylate cyclase (GGDEF)-like protein
MSVFLLVNIQTVYTLAGLIVLMGSGTVFFLRTLDEQSSRLLSRLSICLMITAAFILAAASLMVEQTLALALNIANFGIVFGVITVAELTRRLLGLQRRTGLAVILIVLAFLVFEWAYDPQRPLISNALRHAFEGFLGLALALRLSKLPQSGTPILKQLLTLTAALYGGVALFELANTLSQDLALKKQGANLTLGLTQTAGIAGTSVLTGLFIALLMLTVNAQMANRLRHLLSTDELTRLGSRRGFNEQAPSYIARCEQAGNMIAVLMLDIDHFKKINDRYGHPVGDAILKNCARQMRASLRPDAMLARYGGEEFCALVPVDRIADARAVGERLRQQVNARPFGFAGFEIRCTISIGIAFAHADQALSIAIEQADQALYEAKRTGRNKVLMFGDASNLSSSPAPTLESSLPGAAAIVPV